MILKKVFSFFFLFISISSFAINTAVLEQIIKRYEESESDALRIEINGKVILELGEEIPFETMSITKSIDSLAIGILIDQGKIPSIDVPIHTYFPEWNVEGKRDITIRHILTHTTGLKSFSSFEEKWLTLDYVQSGLEAEPVHEVGEGFIYNNRIVNILSGIVEKASGKRLDVFVRENLFIPLGIHNSYWEIDSMGHAIGMCGLKLTARDLSTVGKLILQNGEWEGKQIVSKEWLDLSFQPSQSHNLSCGLLWWLDKEQKGSWPQALLLQYEKAGISQSYIDILRALDGKSVPIADTSMHDLFGSEEEFQSFLSEIKGAGLEYCILESGEINGYRADGYLGQYLLILPKDNIIAVRQIEYGKKPDDQVDEFDDFVELIHKLNK